MTTIDNWSRALAVYTTALRAAGRSEGTIRVHRHYLAHLSRRHPRPWDVTTPDLCELLAAPHWRPETRKSCRTSLRSFYRWAYGSGYITSDPSDRLPTVTIPPAVARPTPEHLVRVIVREDTRVGIMAMLAAYCGLRRGEIARVHSRDLVGDELRVFGKGRRERVVPVTNARLLAHLQAADGWLFPGPNGHLSPGHVGRLMSRAMPDGWTAHTLRHRMATVAYAGTRDLLAVSAVLGHSRPETTQRYVRMPNDALRRAVEAASA